MATQAWDLRVARFAVVGVCATLAHGGLMLLAGPPLNPALVANAVAAAGAAVVSYLGHKLVTFRAATPHRISLPRFALQTAAAWLVSSAIVALLAPHIHFAVVTLAVMVVVPAFNYFVLKHWTFADAPSDNTRG